MPVFDRRPIFRAAKDCGVDLNKRSNIERMDAGIDAALASLCPSAAPVVPIAPVLVPAPFAGGLTARIALELVDHEAIVQEAYKDSVGVWTWGIGVTTRSGHAVERYKDNPQPISKCLEVYIWLLQTRYLPEVLAEFKGHPLSEAQLGAALSFHYNTGAISKTAWVDLWMDGKTKAARSFLESHYLNGGDLKDRRLAEAALFFDGKWKADGTANVYPVRKPSYTPYWSRVQRVDISADVKALLP